MNKAHPAAHSGSPDAAFCSARNCRTVIKANPRYALQIEAEFAVARTAVRS